MSKFKAGDRVRVIAAPPGESDILDSLGTVLGPSLLFDVAVTPDLPYQGLETLLFDDNELELVEDE